MVPNISVILVLNNASSKKCTEARVRGPKSSSRYKTASGCKSSMFVGYAKKATFTVMKNKGTCLLLKSQVI